MIRGRDDRCCWPRSRVVQSPTAADASQRLRPPRRCRAPRSSFRSPKRAMETSGSGTRDAGLVRVRARQPAHRAPAGSQDQPFAAGNAGEVDRDRPWSRTVERDGDYESGVPAALQQTTALNMIRDRASNIWIAAIPGTPAPEPQRIGISVGGPLERRNSLRGSRWNVRRYRSRSRTVARSCVYHVFGCARHACGRRGPLCRRVREVWFGPSSGGLFWIRNGVVTEARHAGLGDGVYSIHGGDGEPGSAGNEVA